MRWAFYGLLDHSQHTRLGSPIPSRCGNAGVMTCRQGCKRGQESRNRVPPRPPDWQTALPPWASAIALTTASPSPLPPLLRERDGSPAKRLEDMGGDLLADAGPFVFHAQDALGARTMQAHGQHARHRVLLGIFQQRHQGLTDAKCIATDPELGIELPLEGETARGQRGGKNASSTTASSSDSLISSRCNSRWPLSLRLSTRKSSIRWVNPST